MTTSPELDVEDFVIAYLTAQGIVPAAQLAARMPPVVTPPFVLVQRIAGGDDRIVDHATIQIDSFNMDQTSASDTARAIHHAMRQLHPKTVVTADSNTWNIYSCSTELAPFFEQWAPSAGGAVLSRYIARYVIDVRLPKIPGY